MNQGNAVETFPSPIEADSQNQFKELIEIIAQSVKCEYALCIGHEFPLPSFLATAKCPEELILAYKARNYQSIAENLPINDETLPCPYIIKKIYSAEQQLIATLVLIKPADANFIVSSNSFVNLFCKHIELLHENSVLRGEGKKLHLDYNTLNRKYELIVKAFIKPCIVISTSLHIIAFNSIAATLYKHALNLTLKEGEDFIKYVVPGRLQSFMDNMKAVISGNEKSRELQFLDPYFNKWWMIVYTPIMGSDNQIEAISIFFRNITNEKFVEKQFEEISDVARVGGWEYDIKNKSLYLTQVAKENFGIDKQNHPSLSEVYGYFYSTASKHVIKSAFTSLIKHGKEFDEELQIVKSNGEVIWVRIKAKAEIFNDKPTRAYGTFQDIDSKRLIYEELLHNQLYLKSLFEYNPYAIFSLNMDGKFINANQSMAELAGTTVENLLKQNDYTHFFEKSELPKLHQNFIKVKKKDPISFETTAVTYKGAVKYINLTFVPIIINNDIEAVYGIARDITERKQAERTIRESEYRLKLVLEAANVGWWDWDIDNNITYFDPKWWAMIGYQPEQQLISPNYKEYFNNLPIHPNDVERVIKTYKTAIDGDASKYEFEYRIQHKQGHYVPVLARGYILRNQNGKPIRISGTNMDLTEIKLVEQAFHQSQDNLRTVFENTTVGYILFDTHLQILSFNGPAAHFTLSEHGKPLVAGNSFLSYFPEEQHERIMGVALKVLSGEKLEHETLHNATGEDNWYYVKYSPVANKNSEVVGFVLAMENITDRKKQELEKATSFKLLSEQNKRLLGFSYIVSHNLRSHTSNIKSIVQFLKETDEQEERTEMLTHLTTVTDLLHETIHNLHDVVSVHNAVGLVNIPLNLSGYVGKAINVLGDQIEAKKALINNNVPYDVTIEYHPAYLESITLNFISNAIKYAHPDRHPVVNINYNMENNEKILIIADNGIGIDLKRNGDKLFGLYKTFHDNQDARGVGLFITKNQIESMGGRVEVESELGIGTTFKIYFK